ncbi:MAG: histidine--tRNA ligase [Myxococcota bacterium]
MSLQAPRGMNDILPVDIPSWLRVEALARQVFGAHGYQEIRTPLLEATELFERGVGGTTDIVQKEMYTFEGREPEKGEPERLTLRPEGTASVVRAYVEHKMHGQGTERRFLYLGPMFRAERPQKGRYRQFHQIGCEAFGVADPWMDVEMLSMIHMFLTQAGVGGLAFKLNTIGCNVCRPQGVAALKAYFEQHRAELCADCQRRLDRNPLRLLDCKVQKDRALAQKAPTIRDAVMACSNGCGTHYSDVRRGLDALKIPYEEDPLLVRGLDYYTRTVFEVTSSDLGAQSAVTAGGRYDNLVEQLGGEPTPAIGFALGIERLLLLQKEKPALPAPDVSIVIAEDAARVPGLVLAQQLRALGLSCDLDHQGKSLKSQMRRADRVGSRWAVVLGGRELESKSITLKNLRGGASKDLGLDPEQIRNAVTAERG